MPPVRTDVARRHTPLPYAAASSQARFAPAVPYASMLCPVLARRLGSSIEQAMICTGPANADAFLALASKFWSASASGYEPPKAEWKILRVLLRQTPRQRQCLAKYGYTLLGAELAAEGRLEGLRTLCAAAAFGPPRLARIVQMCLPLAHAPERRLAMLQSLWRTVGPEQLPRLMEVCRPVLDQRRFVPEEASRAMEQVLQRGRQMRQTERADDRFGVAAAETGLTALDDCCPNFVDDDDENVMISSRINAARHAIGIVRAHVPEPLHFAPVLACVQLFVEGMAQHGCVKTQAMCQLALQTLTGQQHMAIPSWRHGRALAASWPPVGTFDAEGWPPSTPVEAHADRRRLWRNVRLEMDDAEPIGMGELCSLIWQAIHRYRDPEQNWAQTRRKRANMRHALVSALADCNESKGLVCPVGISQRLLTAVQGYLPFTIDGVDQEAHPQSVVTYLLQSFDHHCNRQEATLMSEIAIARWEASEQTRVATFYAESLRIGASLMGHRPSALGLFKKHLVTALDNLYGAHYLDGERLPD